MEDRYIVHAFFWVPSTDVDSNDQKLENNIKLLTEKEIWFVQHGVFLRDGALVPEYKQRAEDSNISLQLAVCFVFVI